MDNRNTEMTNKRNILGRFFRILVMLHKIPYAHFTEWNNKRKHKALAAGAFLAARGQDGYVHLVNVPQKIIVYGLVGLAVLLSAIPLGFFDDKKICKEVRQELRKRPRYWKRALAVYWFPMASENTVPAEKEQVEVPQSYRDYLSLHFKIGARQEAPNEALQRVRSTKTNARPDTGNRSMRCRYGQQRGIWTEGSVQGC